MDIAQRRGGWQPDLPDHRDYTIQHAAVHKLLKRLKPDPERSNSPSRVDLREYCAPIEDQGDLPTSCAHACVAMVQYFERRCCGRLIRPSRLFVHSNSASLLHQRADHSVALRAALKALVCFGWPPEAYWPYRAAAIAIRPTAFTYGLAHHLHKVCFLRFDPRQQTGAETLRLAKRFLAAGFPFVLGFPVSDAVGQDAGVPFPTAFDSIRTGMAVLAVGYDDNMRIHADKGGILIRNSWGIEWGDHGYGWLPYSYVRERLANDLWTLLKESWLKSGELYRPNLQES